MKKTLALVLAVALVSSVSTSNVFAALWKTSSKATTTATLNETTSTTAVNKSVDTNYASSSMEKNSDGTITYTNTSYTEDGTIDGQTITIKDKSGNVVSKEIVAYENGKEVGRADIKSGGPVQTYDQLREAVNILKHADFSGSHEGYYLDTNYFSSTNTDLAKCTNVTSVSLYKSDFERTETHSAGTVTSYTAHPCGLDDFDASEYGDTDVVATVKFSVTDYASTSTQGGTHYYKKFSATYTKNNTNGITTMAGKLGSKTIEVSKETKQKTTAIDKIKTAWNNSTNKIKTSWNNFKTSWKNFFKK